MAANCTRQHVRERSSSARKHSRNLSSAEDEPWGSLLYPSSVLQPISPRNKLHALSDASSRRHCPHWKARVGNACPSADSTASAMYPVTRICNQRRPTPSQSATFAPQALTLTEAALPQSLALWQARWNSRSGGAQLASAEGLARMRLGVLPEHVRRQRQLLSEATCMHPHQ